MTSAPPQELEADELSLALGRLAREREAAQEQARPSEWEAVARGELSVEQARARRAEVGDEDVERAAAYFRPFDADETASLVDKLLEQAPDNVVPLARPAEPPAKPHDPGSSRFWWIPGGMLVAAAAAIVMWWVWPPSEEIRKTEDPVRVATRDPLPSYVLETDGGLKELRGDGDGDEQGRHRYQRDTAFEWVLRPKVDVSEPVAVRGFAVVGDDAGLPINLDELASVAESGAIRVAGTIAALKLEPGSYTIVLAVGRPDELPADVAQVLTGGDGAPWMARRIEIVIED